MSTTTERRERTPEQIARDCRVNRIVDWWVSRTLSGITITHPSRWRDWEWAFASRDAGQRLHDAQPDDAMRAAIIERIDARTRTAATAEIDAIAASLERRRTA